MKVIGIILLIVGVIGVFLSMMMYGDIGIAAFIGSITALITGVGFFQINKALK